MKKLLSSVVRCRVLCIGVRVLGVGVVNCPCQNVTCGKEMKPAVVEASISKIALHVYSE